MNLKTTLFKATLLCAGLPALLAIALPASAAVVTTAVKENGNVTFSTEGGVLDLAGLTPQSYLTGIYDDYVNAANGMVNFNAGNTVSRQYSGISGPNGFALFTEPSYTTFLADSVSGASFGLAAAQGRIALPSTFTSGGTIGAASMTFNGQNFASMGIQVGSYEWSWAGDSIRVNVVPIPAAVWLFGSALAGLGWFRRRQIV